MVSVSKVVPGPQERGQRLPITSLWPHWFSPFHPVPSPLNMLPSCLGHPAPSSLSPPKASELPPQSTQGLLRAPQSLSGTIQNCKDLSLGTGCRQPYPYHSGSVPCHMCSPYTGPHQKQPHRSIHGSLQLKPSMDAPTQKQRREEQDLNPRIIF